MEEANPGLQGLAAGSRKKTKTATARIKPEKSLSSPWSWSWVSREEARGAALLDGGGGGGKRWSEGTLGGSLRGFIGGEMRCRGHGGHGERVKQRRRGRRKVVKATVSPADGWVQRCHVGRVEESVGWVLGEKRIWRDKWAAAGLPSTVPASWKLGRCSLFHFFHFLSQKINRKAQG